MPNIVNQMVVRELQDEFKEAEGMVLVNFGGLTVEETSAIRGKLAEKNVRFKMVRNSLAKRVLADRDVTFPEDSALKGNTGIAYGDAEAAIDAAKVFADKEIKKQGKVVVKGGMLEGNADVYPCVYKWSQESSLIPHHRVDFSFRIPKRMVVSMYSKSNPTN